MQWIIFTHCQFYMYIIYVLTHVYFYIQDRITILGLNRWNILEWQIKSMNFQINGCIHNKMQCDIILCLLWKTSLCNVFIQITISFCNYIYLLMILIFYKFKVISLSFESPFMHIKHLKCSCQIMLLNLNVLFVYQMCTIHSQNLRGDSYWW
jgi:hypothetical protein